MMIGRATCLISLDLAGLVPLEDTSFAKWCAGTQRKISVGSVEPVTATEEPFWRAESVTVVGRYYQAAAASEHVTSL